MFYEYRQNNSGGDFIITENVTIHVIVEARDAVEADFRAERIGIYFNGCDTGDDCPCCGDRWDSSIGGDKGSEEPTVYGSPVARRYEDHTGFAALVFTKRGEPDVIVHYLDGRVEPHYPPGCAPER